MTTAELPRSAIEGALLGWLLDQRPTVQRLPVDLMSPAEKAGELQRLQARRAMDAAYEAELVMGLAVDRPDDDDPPLGHPGARRRGPGSPVPGTSEFLPEELAQVLNCSRSFAAGVLSDAYQLVERMPAVWAACAAGDLDWFRARVFADGVFDAVTMSFGLRNTNDLDLTLRELLRVTRPGGRLVVCEFSHPTWRPFRTVYVEYLMRALPSVARAISSDPAAYVYLAESIRAWPAQEALARRLQEAGWDEVAWRDLTGGIVALHRGARPA